MHSPCCLAVLLASVVLCSSPVQAADVCNYSAGYICHDKLVFRPNGMGPWGAYQKGDGKAPNGFAAKACAEGGFEGKSGWRLPTEQELLAFVSSDVRPRAEGNGWVLNGGATWTSTPATRPGYSRYVSLRLDMLDNGQLPDSDARYVTCVRETDISMTGSGDAVRSSTVNKSSSYAPSRVASGYEPSAQPVSTSKPADKPDNGCWNAGSLSQIFVSTKPTSSLCSGKCMTVTVTNNSEGRIASDICLKRPNGGPDDCGQIAVRPGTSNSWGGEGIDYSIKYWGSNNPMNDWTCKNELSSQERTREIH